MAANRDVLSARKSRLTKTFDAGVYMGRRFFFVSRRCRFPRHEPRETSDEYGSFKIEYARSNSRDCQGAVIGRLPQPKHETSRATATASVRVFTQRLSVFSARVRQYFFTVKNP